MKNRCIAAFAIALGIFCFFISTKVAIAATNSTVRVPLLNVRTGPGVGYNKIDEILNGQTYPVIESRNGWYRLQIGQKSGWVCGDYISLSNTQPAPVTKPEPVAVQTPQPSPTGSLKVKADLLNVRQNAGVSYSKIGSIKLGETYQYFEKSGVWYKIKLNTSFGWVHGDYVAVLTQETTAPPPALPSRGSTSTAPVGGGTSVVDSITADIESMNVVKDAGFNAQVLGQLSKGSSYKVLETRFGWYKIMYGSQEGWIRNRGVTANYKKVESTPTSPVQPVLNALNEIGSVRVYKTLTRNLVAIPVDLKIGKNTGITSLKPEIAHSKTADGKINITINNSCYKGPELVTGVNDNELLSSVSVVTSNNTNSIIINGKMNLDYEISNVAGYSSEDDQYRYFRTYIVINLRKAAGTIGTSPGSPAVQKNNQGKARGEYLIALDAGHGGSSPGAVSSGYEEKVYAFDITKRLNDILKAQGYDIYLTRDKDEYVSLSDRADGANILKTDIFVSIHLNSYSNKSVNGTETLYNYSAVKPGNQLAWSIQKHLIAALNRADRGIVDRPDLAVLNSTYMPAALAEIMFMSNQTELGLITQETIRQKTAQAMANAINEYFGFSN